MNALARIKILVSLVARSLRALDKETRFGLLVLALVAAVVVAVAALSGARP